jgi:hypothetical protein
MLYHLFIGYRYTKTINSEDTMLQALNLFQQENATLDYMVFTVLAPEKGFAFSQEYRTFPDRKVQWKTMFKHEAGIDNPGDIPSYDVLLSRVPKCKDDSCDASHCPKCGGHKVGWYTKGLCSSCENEEDIRHESSITRIPIQWLQVDTTPEPA